MFTWAVGVMWVCRGVQQVWCTWGSSGSFGGPWAVELRHEFPVGGPGSGEVVALFFELEP